MRLAPATALPLVTSNKKWSGWDMNLHSWQVDVADSGFIRTPKCWPCFKVLDQNDYYNGDSSVGSKMNPVWFIQLHCDCVKDLHGERRAESSSLGKLG